MNRLKAPLRVINTFAMLVIAYALLADSGQAAPSASTTAALMTTTQFIYEGRLSGATGTYDLQFRLYDAPTGGSLVGAPNPNLIADTLLDSGEYRVVLNFGAAAFTGHARYVEVGYRPGTSASDAPYTPAGRALILPTAYALNLRPGAKMVGPVACCGQAMLRADNTGSGVGLWGSATSNDGVYGVATTGTGVEGNSTSGAGVVGKSQSWVGTYGESSTQSGVWGKSTSGTGVWGESSSATGVVGKSQSYVGTYGESSTQSGVWGKSTTASGVQGTSSSGAAVYASSGSGRGVSASTTSGTDGVYGETGRSDGSGVQGRANGANAAGVFGVSGNGVGVWGRNETGGFAMRAEGHATQSLASGGWAKFMAFIDPYDAADPIKQCYNSQLPGSQAASGNCGFTVNLGSGCNYPRTINFGSKVNDRFVVVTPLGNASGSVSAELRPGFNTNAWTVFTFYPTGKLAEHTCAKFFVVVY